MKKMSFAELRAFFTGQEIHLESTVFPSLTMKRGATKSHGQKHDASKKGHKHIHNLSKGQANHNKFGGK